MGGWIEVSMPKALLDAAICFDFRALHGDASLVVSLREWVSARIKSQPAFLRHMAEAALQARPALNRLGGFATEDAPGASDSIDLKLQGARIFVDAARICALACGAPQTNTAERLRAVRGALGMNESDAAAAVEAFFLVQRLRLQNQVAQREGGPDAANRVAPGGLNRIEQAALKEALRTAKDLQSRLALDYQL
jgi:CBS domain-containing protein